MWDARTGGRTLSDANTQEVPFNPGGVANFNRRKQCCRIEHCIVSQHFRCIVSQHCSVLQHSLRPCFPLLRIGVNAPCLASVSHSRPRDARQADRLPDTVGTQTTRGNLCNRRVRLTAVGFDRSDTLSTAPASEPRSALLTLTHRNRGKSPRLRVVRDRRDT